MAESPITYLTLADLCDRWHVKPAQIAAVALEGKLKLSIPVPGVFAEIGDYVEIDEDNWQRMPEERRRITGVFDLYPRDAWALIKDQTRPITDLARGANGFIDFEPEGHGAPYSAVADDILIRRDEVERFEAESAPAGRSGLAEPAARGGPGVPPKFDWDGFWIEVCRRIHDDGVPPTQAALVRDLLDWFDANGIAAPDQSTVKKKISRLWKVLRAAMGTPTGQDAMNGSSRGMV